MAQLQGGNGTEEDMGGDDVEVNKANEVAAEELDDEGEGGEGVNGLVEDMELELIDGDREGVKWLVINQVHICYIRKDRGTKKTDAWECSGRRRMGCEFKIRTTKTGGPGALKIIKMSNPEIHTCSADKVAPVMQKFRLKLALRMQQDLDVGWSKIWREERSLLLGNLQDNPGLLQQVILEMSDVEAFRRSAARARGKMVPKIPTEHKDMDPAKVNQPPLPPTVTTTTYLHT